MRLRAQESAGELRAVVARPIEAAATRADRNRTGGRGDIGDSFVWGAAWPGLTLSTLDLVVEKLGR
jgi:hypothetical protein